MASSIRIYLIEDDRHILRFVEQTLELRPEWRLVGSSDSFCHAQVMAPTSAADVFLVDLGLPDGRGEDILRLLAEQRPSAELLVFTVFGDESRLLTALQMGATGYVLKGCSAQELIDAIEDIQDGGAPISPLLARMLLKKFRPAAPCSPSSDLSDTPALSDRETDVLKLVAQGYVNKEIAVRLGIGTATVSTHIKNLYRKLSARTRVQAVKAAQERGLI
jgi:DNA-binding NarL/FixJ family response regulator